MSRRGAWVASLALAATLAVPVAAPAARRRCAMPGHTILRTSLIRVVRVRDSDAESVAVSGCAFATNRVFELGSGVQSETTTTSIGVDKHAATWVAVSTSSQSQYGYGAATRVTNLRTGRGYSLHAEMVGLGESAPAHGLARYELNDLGQVAAVFYDYPVPPPPGPPAPPSATRIVAVSARGVQRIVDFGAPADLPASSLLLDRRLFVWTHSGQVRYAWL